MKINMNSLKSMIRKGQIELNKTQEFDGQIDGMVSVANEWFKPNLEWLEQSKDSQMRAYDNEDGTFAIYSSCGKWKMRKVA